MKILYIIGSVVLIGAAVFFLVSFYPREQIAEQLPFDVTEGDGYVTYFPSGGDQFKAVIIVTAPGSGREAAIKYMKLWRSEADRRSFVLLSFTESETEDDVGRALRKLPENLKQMKIVMTGLSAGGYFSCGVGLRNDDLVDAIIPMASFCNTLFFPDKANSKIPILTVIGSEDTWALGEDGTLPYEAKKDLNVSFIIVEGLGHAFPRDAMDEVGEWIENL